VTIRSAFNDYNPFLQDATYNPSRGDIPRELEEAIEQSTREEFEAELKRQCALRWLYQKGSMTMNGDVGTGEGKARLLEERDIPAILEVLFTEEHYRRDPNHIKEHLTRVAKGGLDRYSNDLVAERDGKAVGRAVIDTPYPPYAELAGLLVHPQYRGRGVGTELVEGCISLARRCDCNIMYLMIWRDDLKEVFRFYEKRGFQPAMLKGFDEEEMMICLIRLKDVPFCNEFLKIHPLSIFSISGSRMDFHGNQAFEMRWTDSQTGDFLTFYMEGALLKSMPRITGIARKEKSKEFDAWINVISEISTGRPGEFEVGIKNKGGDKMNLHINHLLPNGTTIDGKPSNIISSQVKGEEHWRMRFEIAQGFAVPLSASIRYWRRVNCDSTVSHPHSPFPQDLK
jgi:GNAT superfamily N-acetyltransferase